MDLPSTDRITRLRPPPARFRLFAAIGVTLPALLLASLLAAPVAMAEETFGPDLVVTMSDDPDPVAPGGTVTITVLVSNIGNVDSFTTTLVFSTDGDAILDAQVTGGTGEECSFGEGTTATCDLGTIPASSGTALLAANEAEATFEVAAPDAPGTEFLSDAEATSFEQTDLNPSDNTDTELTNVSEGGESATGTVPPGGSITTLEGPLNADDPFAVALRNVSGEMLDVTIEEEACDGTQEGDPLCSEPSVGGVAGDFMFAPSTASAPAATTTSSVIAIGKLFYDRSVLEGVERFRIFYQKSESSPVIRLPRCGDGIRTECFIPKRRANGDEVVRVRFGTDPRVTRR